MNIEKATFFEKYSIILSKCSKVDIPREKQMEKM